MDRKGAKVTSDNDKKLERKIELEVTRQINKSKCDSIPAIFIVIIIIIILIYIAILISNYIAFHRSKLVK